MVAGGDVVPGIAVGAGVAGGDGWVQPETHSMTATTDRAAVKRSFFMEEHHGRSYKKTLCRLQLIVPCYTPSFDASNSKKNAVFFPWGKRINRMD
jgi:hypothetical protein